MVVHLVKRYESSNTISTLLWIIGIVLVITIVITLALVVWIVLRIRRIDLAQGADLLTALRATPLIVVIVLDLLDFSLDIFSTPITWAVLTYLRLAPLRLVAVVKDLIPVTNFIPLMTLCWLYARLKNHGAILGHGCAATAPITRGQD